MNQLGFGMAMGVHHLIVVVIVGIGFKPRPGRRLGSHGRVSRQQAMSLAKSTLAKTIERDSCRRIQDSG